jgi:hypothetical protein
MAVFPFAAVVAKLAECESATTMLVVATICVILFAVVLIASRITVAPEPEPADAPREPQPPVAWSWDGVNRQPEEQPKKDEGIKM